MTVPRLRPLALVPLVLALALTGCGDGDDGADPQDPVTVTATETITDEPTPSTPTESPSETATETAEPTPTDGTDGTDLGSPPASYADARAHLDAATGPAQELRRFESPDTTYYCTFGDRFIPPSCEIAESGIRDPEVCGDSPSPTVGRVELSGAGWEPFCNTDTVRMPGATKLDVGGVATWPKKSIECVLEEIGLTCVSTDTERGFFVGPGAYRVF